TARGFAMLMIGATVLALALGTVIAIALTRSVVGPLRTALQAARDVSQGNLDTPMGSGRGDEAGQLLEAMEQMR
ncbi:HAMP domain-containing protein, partial [Escherichia coli]